jgi:inosose dehydratase
MPQLSRREFVARTGAIAAATIASAPPLAAWLAPELLYPPADLSYFDTPIPAAPAEIRIGYAAIAWGGNDHRAIEDVSSLGFRGIQLRANAVREFSSPAELRDLLARHQLKMVALSSGDLEPDTAVHSDDFSTHISNARFVHDVGGLYLQIIDRRPKVRQVSAEDYTKLGRVLTELGKRTADLGISLGYHNHMGAMGQRPEEVDRIMSAADPRYVKLELDVAHYFQGGGDPAKAIQQYRDRLLFLHIKDVEQQAKYKDGYRFVELGRGKVDLPAIFNALQQINFRGWAIVELDDVTDGRTQKESAAISKQYLEKKIGLKI